MRSSFDSLVLFVSFVVKRFYTSAKALSITISLLQELRFDKVGDLIRPFGREDTYAVGKGDLLFGDNRNHVDLALARASTSLAGMLPFEVPYLFQDFGVSHVFRAACRTFTSASATTLSYKPWPNQVCFRGSYLIPLVWAA